MFMISNCRTVVSLGLAAGLSDKGGLTGRQDKGQM